MYSDDTDIPLTVVKSDGGFTYDTSDMACIRDRVNTDNGEWIIYVTDIGQSLHFKVVKLLLFSYLRVKNRN